MQRTIKHLTVRVDEVKRREQVAEITETDYFRDLQRRGSELRRRRGREES
jgi:adenylate cyclase